MSDQYQFEARGRMTAHHQEHGHESRLSQECFNPLEAHLRTPSINGNAKFDIDFSGNVTAIDFQHGGLYQSHVDVHGQGAARLESHHHGEATTVTMGGSAEILDNFKAWFPLQQQQCWTDVHPQPPASCEPAPRSTYYPPAPCEPAPQSTYYPVPAQGGVQVQYQGEQYPTWYPSSQFQSPQE